MFCSENLKISGNTIFKVLMTLEIIAQTNTHGVLTASGMVNNPNGVKLGDVLSLQYQQGESDVSLFQGYIVNIEVQYENNAYYIIITAISGTCRFDSEQKKRSFQNPQLTYGEMTRKLAGKGRAVLVPEKARETIGRLWVQYGETDWEFLKRIAGYLHTVLIPEISNIYPQCSLGIVKGRSYVLDEPDGYEIYMDYESFRLRQNEINCKLSDFRKISIEINQNFNLCDKIRIFKTTYVIMKKQVLLAQGILRFFYDLGTEQANCFINHNSIRLAGNSLEGVVVYREKERVRINLDIDEGEAEEANLLYDYVPLTGNIMYAIPEKGTKVSLYFPNGDESNAMVVCSFNNVDTFSESSNKIFSTKEDKTIEMSPGSLSMYGKNKKQTLKLLDLEGSDINSDKMICLKAGTDIQIKAAGLIYGESDESLFFEHSETGNYIELSGNEINMQGDQIIFSGVTRPKRERKEWIPADGMDTIGKYIEGLMGGIPQNYNRLESLVLGGVPLYSIPKRISNLFEIIGVKEDS